MHATAAYRWRGIMKEEEQKHGDTSVLPTGFRRWLEAGNADTPPTDVQIVTSGRRRLPAHSTVLVISERPPPTHAVVYDLLFIACFLSSGAGIGISCAGEHAAPTTQRWK
ncbi:hypothetical protein B296_00029799 [Ensete ventricosum]|uniref:Uncharacterized protein n=1 Tax=Ensete ventricosum TaxID=4639 RepID=A0A426XQV1_ENSVE|nr:hypothetical protein B296_00029799 [Ensete ventricosum]